MNDIDGSFAAAVARRRMVRSFRDAAVADEHVDMLVQQALAGPSAGNTQSLHLLVLTVDQVREYWSVTLPPTERSDFPWPGLLRAPVLLILYVEPGRYVERYGEADKAHTGLGEAAEEWPVPYWWVDGGAAAQTLLLGAVSLGLGACLFGQFGHEDAVREHFGVPATMRAVGTVAIGYENTDDRRLSASAKRGRRDRSETVHWDVW